MISILGNCDIEKIARLHLEYCNKNVKNNLDLELKEKEARPLVSCQCLIFAKSIRI